jgi:N-acetylmuramic acid 6-phosphate etherase
MPEPSKWRSLPTEQINPATLRIDKLDAADIVSQMLSEDRKMIAAVEREKNRIASGIDLMDRGDQERRPHHFCRRGTSGRLGVLEAAENTTDLRPPIQTSCRPSWLAGKVRSFGLAKAPRTITRRDRARSPACDRPDRNVVVGVSASGITQFVFGALDRARRAGSKIILVTCDPKSELQNVCRLDHRTRCRA